MSGSVTDPSTAGSTSGTGNAAIDSAIASMTAAPEHRLISDPPWPDFPGQGGACFRKA